MIKLHLIASEVCSCPIFVNPSKIVSIYTDTKGDTTVNCGGEEYFRVEETVNEVLARINEVT